MKNKFTLLFCLLISAVAQAGSLKGAAKSSSPPVFEYSEVHEFESDSQGYDSKLVTKYFDKQGKLFAEQKADFSKDLFSPDLIFTDYRTGTIETVTLQKEKGKILFTKSNKDQELKAEATVEFKPNMLAGPGFNNFVRKNFDKLLAGEELEVFFVVLARQDFYRFDVSARKIDGGLLSVKIEMHNFIMKRFVKELRLEYSISDRRLKSFTGLSNLTDDRTQVPHVVIKYE